MISYVVHTSDRERVVPARNRGLAARNRGRIRRIQHAKRNLVILLLHHNGKHPTTGNVEHHFAGGNTHGKLTMPEASHELETAKNNRHRKGLRLPLGH